MDVNSAEKFAESWLASYGITADEVNVIILGMMVLSVGLIFGGYWFLKLKCSDFSCKRISLSFSSLDKAMKKWEQIEADVVESAIRDQDEHRMIKEKVIGVERDVSDIKAGVYQLHGILLGSQSSQKRSIIHEKDW